MPHDNHTDSPDLLEVSPLESLVDARDRFLELAADWVDPYGPPTIVNHQGIDVVRDDLLGDGVGTKARAADLVVARAPSDTIVYVQPRVGLAGLSLIDCAARHGKRVVLFMPASQRISDHQACTIHRGAEARFVRIAAMPNLNKAAREWADDNRAYFVPLGLRHRLATAALVKTAYGIPEPEAVVTAISTGVLSRALQIAWPNALFKAVAVARNLKDGEKGRAEVESDPKPFQVPERKIVPPFPSVETYDAKAWKWVDSFPDEIQRILFWNVGKDPVPPPETVYDSVNPNVDWIRK